MGDILNLKTFFYENIDDKFKNKEMSYYLVNLYASCRFANLSHEPLIIYYAKAREENNFIKFQNLGDWILFCETIFVKHLRSANKEYYQDMARVSYLQCFKLMGRKVKIYEELADELPQIIEVLQAEFAAINQQG